MDNRVYPVIKLETLWQMASFHDQAFWNNDFFTVFDELNEKLLEQIDSLNLQYEKIRPFDQP